MKRKEGIALAKQFRSALERKNIPVQRMFLYGSVARDTATQDSDIDIAVVCLPFRDDRHKENMELRHARWDLDVRISPYCFHTEDFTGNFFPLAKEIEATGVEI